MTRAHACYVHLPFDDERGVIRGVIQVRDCIRDPALVELVIVDAGREVCSLTMHHVAVVALARGFAEADRARGEGTSMSSGQTMLALAHTRAELAGKDRQIAELTEQLNTLEASVRQALAELECPSCGELVEG